MYSLIRKKSASTEHNDADRSGKLNATYNKNRLEKIRQVARSLLPLPQVLASATPWPTTFKPTAHRTYYRTADKGVELHPFYPESTFDVSLTSLYHSSSVADIVRIRI